MMNTIDAHRETLDIQEIELNTARQWLRNGTIWVTDIGEENIYFADNLDKTYYCKCINV